MPAYLIADIEVTNPAELDEYRKGVPATIAQYGGKYIVRGGALESMEGGWKMNRLVILEFPTMAQAKAWYSSPEYKDLLAMRLRATNSKAVLVEGL